MFSLFYDTLQNWCKISIEGKTNKAKPKQNSEIKSETGYKNLETGYKNSETGYKN